jgi:hypothetical protein
MIINRKPPWKQEISWPEELIAYFPFTENLTLQIEYYAKWGNTLLCTCKYAKQNKYKLHFTEPELHMY